MVHCVVYIYTISIVLLMVHCVVILDFSTCEADINYYFERYDPDTRQWLLNDFDTWFSNPGNSRAICIAYSILLSPLRWYTP